MVYRAHCNDHLAAYLTMCTFTIDDYLLYEPYCNIIWCVSNPGHLQFGHD